MNDNLPLQSERYSPAALGLALSVVLVSPLFVTPRPSFVSGHPWKVELLASIFLLLLMGWRFLKQRSSAGIFLVPADPFFIGIIFATFAFVIWSALSVSWARSPGSVAHHTLTWAVYLAFFVCFAGMIRREKSIRSITAVFCVSVVLISTLCIIDYLTTTDFIAAEGTLRIRYAKFAELLVIIVPVLWALAFYSRSRKRMALFLSIGSAGWLAVMLSLSKGAFIAGVIGFTVLFIGTLVFTAQLNRRKAITVAVIWLAITLSTQIFFSVATAIPSTSDYISGRIEPRNDSSGMRVFTWQTSHWMIADHWLLGVGADNFGVAFNDSRKRMATTGFVAGDGEHAFDDFLFERAHNEFVQIAAELGLVGSIVFAGMFVIFAFWFAKSLGRSHFRLSPLCWGCLAGMAGFFVSSLFSSFSFRAMQNGIAFFLVFAIAANELLKTGKTRSTENRGDQAGADRTGRLIFRTAATFACLFALFSASKGISYYHMARAQYGVSKSEAEELFKKAVLFDPENGAAYFKYALLCSRQGDPSSGSLLMKKAIDLGLGVSPTYSLLAEMQSDASNPAASEKTMGEAVAIFPRSVFARVRYAIFLENNSKPIEAAHQFEIAETIDARQAKGWYSIIKDGSVAAHFKAQTDPGSAAPVELQPQAAVLQFMDETGPSARGNKIAERR
jgi:O-antigen ligase